MQTANPSPFGLTSFALANLLLSFKNCSFYDLDSVVLSIGIFHGGIAQVIAGIMEWDKNDIFSATAFMSYGFFWLSLVGLSVLPAMGWAAPPTNKSLACFLGMWELFSLFMWVASWKMSRVLQVVFTLLNIQFLLLIIGNATNIVHLIKAGGYIGILLGGTALYAGMAEMINKVYDREYLPIGRPTLVKIPNHKELTDDIHTNHLDIENHENH
jgi:succinate-acetate transporter protein